ncbi:hypothetical protein [Alkalitalea saponilacus]|uniref:Outer membrane protein beta-barrel domain-containing protein n=1 Tax=Alkalitalea saponilacus TaxID=889453 RepID=A0A1T5HQN6_9BACT|nr:hypothetical protein [Alkalitalea saponilacus]ASB48423.1 hypothetical protein CDL62_04355 [Alkalitalea saponilacus]SKC22989.1 hypothetical protein SAMN03080601_02630 [Alkalitalea saponilacus]
MRIIISIALLGFIIAPSFAQINNDGIAYGDNQENTTRTRHASEYFPKAGDIAIGFDATPFLNYVGNMFNGATSNSLNLGDNTLHFRYFLTDFSAARVALRINSHRDMNAFYLDDQADQALDPLSRSQVEDRRLTFSNNYELKLGYLMFRGENRLRGFFGGDLFLGYEKMRREFEYGNQMTVANTTPLSVTNWNNGNTASQASRIIESTPGSVFNIGLGAVIGAEYYLLPRVCIGVETGLVYGQTFYGQGHHQREVMVGNNLIKEDFEDSPKSRNRDAFTTFPYTFGNMFLMIHF